MNEDKKELLSQQVAKIEDVLKCLERNFSDLEIEEEVNFMTIVKDNLKALVDKK